MLAYHSLPKIKPKKYKSLQTKSVTTNPGLPYDKFKEIFKYFQRNIITRTVHLFRGDENPCILFFCILKVFLDGQGKMWYFGLENLENSGNFELKI